MTTGSSSVIVTLAGSSNGFLTSYRPRNTMPIS